MIINSKDFLEAYGTGKTYCFIRLPQQIIISKLDVEVYATLIHVCESKQFTQAIRDTYGDNFSVSPTKIAIVNSVHYGINLQWTATLKTYEGINIHHLFLKNKCNTNYKWIFI